MDIRAFQRDPAIVAAGTWVEGLDGMGDAALLVRGLGSPVARDLKARLMRALPRSERSTVAGAPTEAEIAVQLRVLAEAVLLDARGWTAGAEALSVEWLRDFLQRPEGEPFADLVTQAAVHVDNLRTADTEDAAGN